MGVLAEGEGREGATVGRACGCWSHECVHCMKIHQGSNALFGHFSCIYVILGFKKFTLKKKKRLNTPSKPNAFP